MPQSEHQLQSACIKWFDLQYPHLSRCLFAIPNGGQRHPAVAAKLKKEGVRSGVADLFLMIPSTNMDDFHHGVFIELKVGRNKQTETQKEFETLAISKGYKYYLCRSLDEFMGVIKKCID